MIEFDSLNARLSNILSYAKQSGVNHQSLRFIFVQIDNLCLL